MKPEFRAWDKDNKRMANVFEINFLNSTVYLQGEYRVIFDQVELMQYTGLKDKNGKKIFEGDVISHANGEIYKVNNRSGCFMADNVRNGKSLRHDEEDVRVWHTLMESQMLIVILGNVYENPELLKEKVLT